MKTKIEAERAIEKSSKGREHDAGRSDRRRKELFTWNHRRHERF